MKDTIHNLLSSIEIAVDKVHLENPLLRIKRLQSVPSLIRFTEDHAEFLVKREPPNIDALERLVNALSQSLKWVIESPYDSNIELDSHSVGVYAAEILELALSYALVSTVFPAWHRGFATVEVDEQDRRLVFRIPKRFLTFYFTVMIDQQVKRDEKKTALIREAIRNLLPDFSNNPWGASLDKWRPAHELQYQDLAPDWELKYEGDLGGYNLSELRRIHTSFYLWNTMWMKTRNHSLSVNKDDLAYWLGRYSEVEPSRAAIIIEELTYTGKDRRMNLWMQPLILINKRLYWSPTQFIFIHPEREMWVRMARLRPDLHNSLADQRAATLMQRLRRTVEPYHNQIQLIEDVNIRDGQIDAVLINPDGFTLCLELKNMIAPRTLVEFLNADARYKKGKLDDGFEKASKVQLPRILDFAKNNVAEFHKALEHCAKGKAVTKPTQIIGCVLSNWTLGTGSGDTNGLRLINIPILNRLLNQTNGILFELSICLLKGDYLLEVNSPVQKWSYGAYQFEWHSV